MQNTSKRLCNTILQNENSDSQVTTKLKLKLSFQLFTKMGKILKWIVNNILRWIMTKFEKKNP